MNSNDKKRLIIGMAISTAIVASLQYFFPTGNSTPLKIIVGSIIFALVYATGMYWLLTCRKKKDQHNDTLH